MPPSPLLWSGFLGNSQRFPDRPALFVSKTFWSYARLRERALSLAATVQRHGPPVDPPLVAVFAYREATAFAGVLGALLSGAGYVPLNPTFPDDRTRVMLERSGCRSIIASPACAEKLGPMLADWPVGLLVVLPDVDDVAPWRARWPGHTVLGAGDLAPAVAWSEPVASPDSIAYLLFTSGSTGVPKGVMVNHRNVAAFLEYMIDRYGVTEQDRLSQMFDMTFDLSVFDMFMAWERGACVCCPSPMTMIKPGGFIRDLELTLWFSVPSTAVFMKRLGMLKPDRYPSLRWSLFCGEPLPLESARAWQAAAPGSIVENLYGPTELTIACTLYRWDEATSPDECEMGVVPIGAPYPAMEAIVVDADLREVPPGADGELLMRGPQMTPGYFRDPEKTAAAFVVPPGRDAVFYRTGDRVRRPLGDGPMTHLGRLDFQIKVLGHRVELGEIEAVAREASGLDGAVALGWPMTEAGVAAGIVLFLEGAVDDPEALAARMAGRLPEYMTPKAIRFRDRIPLNANGKFDRKALRLLLEETP